MMYMAHHSRASLDARDRVIRHFSYIPDNIRSGNTATQNKFEYATTNGSSVKFSGESQVVGRGRSLSAIYMEEADLYKDFYYCYMLLIPCLLANSDTKLLISTSPLSPYSYFHKLWNNTSQGFHTLEVTLTSIGGIPKIKKRKRIKTLNDITKTA